MGVQEEGMGWRKNLSINTNEDLFLKEHLPLISSYQEYDIGMK